MTKSMITIQNQLRKKEEIILKYRSASKCIFQNFRTSFLAYKPEKIGYGVLQQRGNILEHFFLIQSLYSNVL
uniref:Uncharacterized protein n=1 Tax=Anguilla anguilla TaxID=7936 RepID=A0A0E9XUS4_ANGAN